MNTCGGKIKLHGQRNMSLIFRSNHLDVFVEVKTKNAMSIDPYQKPRTQMYFFIIWAKIYSWSSIFLKIHIGPLTLKFHLMLSL